LLALLATDTLPVALPAVEGVNVVVKVAVCPGFIISPAETPDALKPAPETLTLETVIVELPALVSVMLCVPVFGIVTLPKLTEEELEFSKSVEEVTVSTAALLVALPALLLTATVNCALLSVVVSAGVVYVAAVAPLIAAPFLLHWKVIGEVPLAATLNDAVFPASTDWLAGCVVMAGAIVALVTVKVAALLVALPALLLTATVNFALLSVMVSAGVVYVEEAAPLIAAPFLLH
jgi:hypothetical protein